MSSLVNCLLLLLLFVFLFLFLVLVFVVQYLVSIISLGKSKRERRLLKNNYAFNVM